MEGIDDLTRHPQTCDRCVFLANGECRWGLATVEDVKFVDFNGKFTYVKKLKPPKGGCPKVRLAQEGRIVEERILRHLSLEKQLPWKPDPPKSRRRK